MRVVCEANNGAAAGAGMPECSGSPEGSKDAVQKRLERLDAEADRVAAQLEEVRAAWLKNRDDKDLLQVLKGLEAKNARLDERLKALEAKLPGAGGAASAGAPAAVLDKIYTTFLDSLLTATERGNILALGEGASFPGLEAMVLEPPSPAQSPSSAAQAPSPRDAMVIRVCYPQLARKISSARLRAQLLTGTPGTGKSTFIWYFIRFLHQLDPVPVIVYEVVSDPTSYDSFLIKGRQVFRGTRADFMDEIRDPATWYITDGVQPLSTAAHTLMVSSPSRDKYKLFANRGARFLYMPLWSEKEQLFAFNQLYSAHFKELTLQRVQRLMEVYGSGSIRHVLAMPSQREDVKGDEEEFNQMLQEVDTRKILTGFAIDTLGESSHRLIHLLPSANFETAQRQFCSDYGMDKFIKKAEASDAASLAAFWAGTQGVEGLDSLRGQLFELLSRRSFAAEDSMYRIFDRPEIMLGKAKTTGKGQPVTSERTISITRCQWVQFSDMQDLATKYMQYVQQCKCMAPTPPPTTTTQASSSGSTSMVERVLLVPQSAQQEAVDCIMLTPPSQPGGQPEVAIIQVAGGKTKALSRQALARYLEVLPAGAYQFWYLVPEYRFPQGLAISVNRQESVPLQQQQWLDKVTIHVITKEGGFRPATSAAVSPAARAPPGAPARDDMPPAPPGTPPKKDQ